MGQGSCHLVPRPNNSHVLCFQGWGAESTVTRFSVETLMLLPSSLVFPTRPMCGYNRRTAGSTFHGPCALSMSSEPLRPRGCPSEAGLSVSPRHRETLWRLRDTAGPAWPSHYQKQTICLITRCYTYSCLGCLVCTFTRTFIHFKDEEARKINEVSPDRGVSGYSMYSMIIRDAETSSSLRRALAGSTCCNNKLCSKNLGFHILCIEYKIISWSTNCLQPYLCFWVTTQFTDAE